MLLDIPCLKDKWKIRIQIMDLSKQRILLAQLFFYLLDCGKYCFQDWNLFLHKNPTSLLCWYWPKLQNYHVLILWKALFPTFPLERLTNEIEIFHWEPFLMMEDLKYIHENISFSSLKNLSILFNLSGNLILGWFLRT